MNNDFNDLVALKYQQINNLFLNLPFEMLFEVGSALPRFAEFCQQELQAGRAPHEIIKEYMTTRLQINDFAKEYKVLKLILNFIERQVVLFDALEDSAFAQLHNLDGNGSLSSLERTLNENHAWEKYQKHSANYRIRIVLTSHPTQFYPPQVLFIIQQLAVALEKNQTENIHDLLLQLGKTSFRNEQQPTPKGEADILISQLDNIWYDVIQSIQFRLTRKIEKTPCFIPKIEIGFWPGSDRDGNPNVTADITQQVAAKLKEKIIEHYILDIKALRYKLTFPGMWPQLAVMLQKLRASLKQEPEAYRNPQEFVQDLMTLRKDVKSNHQGLYLDDIDKGIAAACAFGFHFASMDLRQDSTIHSSALNELLQIIELPADLHNKAITYEALSDDAKSNLLETLLDQNPVKLSATEFDDFYINDILKSLHAAQHIQQQNGQAGLHRYVISNTQATHHILEIMFFAACTGWSKENLTLDIVPLFETITDLRNAVKVMTQLYKMPLYRQHLQLRNNQQTVMLGFSDGTKDGGYITANWEIFKTKVKLEKLAQENAIELIFFDGRGGPPSRGGGNTHKFYRAMEQYIKQNEVHLTLQGQTISTNYGTTATAKYNIEQLFTAPLEKRLLNQAETMPLEFESVLDELSEISYQHYQKLKQDPLFIDYLVEVTPLKFYADLNIASRPMSRKKNKTLVFEDLRAIPFVGAWSQMKQNVPAYYGLGTALNTFIEQGKLDAIRKLYKASLFFRTLIANTMQSLSKSHFALTAYLKNDTKFHSLWQKLYDEAELSHNSILKITGFDTLLKEEPVTKASIEMRETLVLPLLVIQQYALYALRQEKAKKLKADQDKIAAYEKLIMKSMAANINASRNAH